MKPQSPVIPGLEEHEIKIAEHQDEYQTLPALPIDNGQRIITRWHLSFRERLIALINGNVPLGQMSMDELDAHPDGPYQDENGKWIYPKPKMALEPRCIHGEYESRCPLHGGRP